MGAVSINVCMFESIKCRTFGSVTLLPAMVTVSYSTMMSFIVSGVEVIIFLSLALV